MYRPMDADEWAKYQRNALRYLRATNAPAITFSTLEELPFSCDVVMAVGHMDDIDRTGDHLLSLRIPVEVFVEIERESGSWPNRIAEHIPNVAYALGRIGCTVSHVVAEIELDAENRPVEILQAEELKITSDTVEHALSQARTLIISHGAPAALDRVHTVFHGYLQAAFEKAGLTMPPDRPGIVELLGLLRKHGIVSFEPELEKLVNQTFRGVQKPSAIIVR
jgi:hypothetical protein